jgi:hypothetical protein
MQRRIKELEAELNGTQARSAAAAMLEPFHTRSACPAFRVSADEVRPEQVKLMRYKELYEKVVNDHNRTHRHKIDLETV